MQNVQANNCIAINDVKQLIINAKQKVKIIDVRTRDEYDESHIPGAINISVSNIELAVALFDRQDFIITACGKGGGRSTEAAEKLKDIGFKNTHWLCGGTFGWGL